MKGRLSVYLDFPLTPETIDFLAIHPQYRHSEIAQLFLDKLADDLLFGKEISLTTYRTGDKADTGYRKEYRRLGFAERELLVEYGYPTSGSYSFLKIRRTQIMPETQRKTPENPLAQSFNTLSLIQFAFPSMIMMVFMGLYTITDTVFVSRFVGTNALSSINIVCPVINIIVGLGTMLATGGSAIIAKKWEMEIQRKPEVILLSLSCPES